MDSLLKAVEGAGSATTVCGGVGLDITAKKSCTEAAGFSNFPVKFENHGCEHVRVRVREDEKPVHRDDVTAG